MVGDKTTNKLNSLLVKINVILLTLHTILRYKYFCSVALFVLEKSIVHVGTVFEKLQLEKKKYTISKPGPALASLLANLGII